MLTRQKCRKTIFEWLTSSSLLPTPVCFPVLCRSLRARPLRMFISLIYLWHITPLRLSPSLPFTQLSTRNQVAIATSSLPAPESKSGDEKWFRALCVIAMTWFLYFSVFFIAISVTQRDRAHTSEQSDVQFWCSDSDRRWTWSSASPAETPGQNIHWMLLISVYTDDLRLMNE